MFSIILRTIFLDLKKILKLILVLRVLYLRKGDTMRYLAIIEYFYPFLLLFREDLEPTSVWKKVEVFSVPAAITSKSLPQPLLSPGVTYTVLAVTRVDSPSSLVVRLDVSSGCYQRIVNVNINSLLAQLL